MGQGEGGEKCNKILLKNNIYSDQGPVPDVGITLPRGGHQANIFSFKWSKTQLFVDPNLTVSDSESMKVQVRRLEQSILSSELRLCWDLYISSTCGDNLVITGQPFTGR